MKRIRKFFLKSILGLVAFCLMLGFVSVLVNSGLPQESAVVETLSAADKTRLAEVFHLHTLMGDRVWPGWGSVEIPSIAYNESYAFLVGYPDPPVGWIKVPQMSQRGGPWEMVPGDSFNGQPYYRQPLPNPAITPEGFTVLVGERWASSLMTLDRAKISLRQEMRQDLPAIIRPIFPYKIFINLVLGGSDKYISLVEHEAFHAYQGTLVPQKLADAENANRAYGEQYPWEDETLQADWQTELDLLAEILRNEHPTRMPDLARQFIKIRTARRETANLSPELVRFERQREWLEGLARYAELEIWRQAYLGDYMPLPETSTLSDFEDYTGFETRWSQELDQMRRMASDEGDGRFYYSGMAQAYMLDQLMPEWKQRAFDESVWLDSLIVEALRDKK